MKPIPYQACRLALFACTVASCLVSLRLSIVGFSGYDVSPMIDAGWRVISGQVPGRDFVVTFPPSLYLATALSFYFFGVTWKAIALGECILYACLCLLGIRLASLLQGVLDRRDALTLAVAFVGAQTILLISINYLWHSSLAEAFAIYAVLATAVVVSLPRRSTLQNAELSVHLIAAFILLLLSKPNTALPTLLLCIVVLAQAGVAWKWLASLVALGALLANTILLLSVHTSLPAMFAAYRGLTGRLLPKPFFNGILFDLYAVYGLANILVYVILFLLSAGLLWKAWKDRSGILGRPRDLLAIGSIAIAIIGMGTNFDFKLTDTPLFLIGLFLFSLSPVVAKNEIRLKSCVALVLLSLLAGYFGVTRLRMQIVGSWADERCPGKTRLNEPFFGKQRVCVVVSDTLREVDKTLASTHLETRIFFGPSIEFLYARNRVTSPLHLPNWWDPGSSYPMAREAEVVNAWKNDRFEILIFSRGDLAQLPSGVIAGIASGYVLVPGTQMIDVYVPRTPAGLASVESLTTPGR